MCCAFLLRPKLSSTKTLLGRLFLSHCFPHRIYTGSEMKFLAFCPVKINRAAENPNLIFLQHNIFLLALDLALTCPPGWIISKKVEGGLSLGDTKFGARACFLHKATSPHSSFFKVLCIFYVNGRMYICGCTCAMACLCRSGNTFWLSVLLVFGSEESETAVLRERSHSEKRDVWEE